MSSSTINNKVVIVIIIAIVFTTMVGTVPFFAVRIAIRDKTNKHISVVRNHPKTKKTIRRRRRRRRHHNHLQLLE
jgi:Flp pilus assembly protein protease CpaA